MGQSQKVTIRANEIIFREGELGDCAYLVESGRVLVFLNKSDREVPLKILGEGEVFGEMALIDSSPRSASCRATTDCRLVVVTKDQLLDRVHSADPIVRLLMKVLMERLRSQNDKIRGVETALPTIDPLTKIKKEALDRINLENRLANALDDDEFVPFYQPIYNLKTQQIIGCESLIRWVTKDQGIVSPAVFMDVMEDTSLILKAGQLMLEKSFKDLPAMSSQFQSDEEFQLSINISGRQFASQQFISSLEQTRQAMKINPSQVNLELTERIMAEGSWTLKVLQDCRDKGYYLAIDDFGTGFSSLQYLAQMPLTDLKIDRSFVSKMQESPKSLSIVQSLVHLSKLLGMSVTAEGIETRQQLKILTDLGVTYGQGFLFSKPIPLADFLKMNSRVAA